MTLERLRETVMHMAEARGDIVTLEVSDELPPETPAWIIPLSRGFQIEYSHSLSGPELSEGIGHELAHVLLIYRGLIDLRHHFASLDGYLLLQIGNAISHASLIDVLRDEFGIESNTHLRLLEDGLSVLEDCAQDSTLENEIIIGIGVALFDIIRTIPTIERPARAIAKSNPVVERTLKAAERHLAAVSVSLGQAEQLVHVRKFLFDSGL